MEREILFRGRRLDNGELVEGYYFERKDTQGNIVESIIICDGYEQIRGGRKFFSSDLGVECYRVDANTVQAFEKNTCDGGGKE